VQILLKVAWRKSSFKILKNSSLQILINTDRAGIIICEFSTENLTTLPDESVRATAFLLDSRQEFPSFAFSQERHCSQMNKKTRLPCPSVHCSVVDCFLWILLLVVTSGRSAFSFVLRGLSCFFMLSRYIFNKTLKIWGSKFIFRPNMPFGHLKKKWPKIDVAQSHIFYPNTTSVFCMKQFTYRYNTQPTTHNTQPKQYTTLH